MGTEAFRTQGKAKLRLEGQSLGRTRLLPKITAPRSRGSHSQLSREIWARTCKNRGISPTQLSTEDTCRNTLLKQGWAAVWRYLLPFFSLLYLQRFPAFPRSCDAMAAAFQHFGAWTAPTCNPSAHHPSRTPLSPPPWSILLPAPAQPALLTPSAPPSPPSPSWSPPSPAP